MITLITGAPGAGKTLLAVTDFLLSASREGRRIIVDGIPELAVDHIAAPAVSQWTKVISDPASQDGKKLVFDFPEGALVVIDEAQRVYRPRPVGSKVPPEVAAFETHRHQGLDFIILTQHPNLIDANVRKLVGRHLHIRELGILGRKVYEWPEASDPNKFRTAPIQRSYKLHKKGFTLYKSASLHVKPKRGLPKGLLAVALAVPLLLAGSIYAYRSVQSKVEPSTVQAPKPNVLSSAVSAVEEKIDPRLAMLIEFSPRVPGRPETAPAYDELRQVKNMPVVAGCVSTSKRCTCQTQSGTDAGLDRSQCLAWLSNPPFDAYREVLHKPERDEKAQPSGTVSAAVPPVESKQGLAGTESPIMSSRESKQPAVPDV